MEQTHPNFAAGTAAAPSGAAVAEAERLSKVYRRGAEEIRALEDLSFTLRPGEFHVVLGPSGAGKTTLLNLLGVMDVPTSGTLRVAGETVMEKGTVRLSEGGRDRVRRGSIGFIFTEFFLMPTLTALDNVRLPLLWTGTRDTGYARDLLVRVGLGHRLTHRPSELSGGEMQRVAIARALCNRPRLLLADEPTGNLDTRTRDGILELFQELSADGLSIVLATHDHELVRGADRVLHLDEGILREEK
jgi:putative ABC transport system ATP-binding protein